MAFNHKHPRKANGEFKHKKNPAKHHHHHKHATKHRRRNPVPMVLIPHIVNNATWAQLGVLKAVAHPGAVLSHGIGVAGA